MTQLQQKTVEPQKKKHHFIPKTYLKHFTDKNDKLVFFRKDDPKNPLRVTLDNVGHRRYYYSQPMPGGGQDNNSLEDAFSDIESHWNRIMEKIHAGDSINLELENIFQFVALLRVRVPAVRDSIEFMRADLVKMTMRQLDKLGQLAPKPEGFEDILNHVQVSIDPHQSIHAMPHMMKGFGHLMGMVGFRVLRNKTGIPLLTSDNPVVVLDPDVQEKNIRPYQVRPPQKRVEIILPIDPQHILHGHTDYKPLYSRQGILYENCSGVSFVKRANRLVARYGYEAIYASTDEHAPLIEKHASLSPVPEFQVLPHENGEVLISGWKFGQRLPKPKWERKKEGANDAKL